MHKQIFKIKEQSGALKLNPGPFCPPINLSGPGGAWQIGLNWSLTLKTKSCQPDCVCLSVYRIAGFFRGNLPLIESKSLLWLKHLPSGNSHSIERLVFFLLILSLPTS